MKGFSWQQVLARIPSSYYEGLTLTTKAGVQLIVQSILRSDDLVLILRGRTAGSNESGKLIMVPYDQITFLSFTQDIAESQLDEIFGAKDGEGAATEQKEPTEQTETAEGGMETDGTPQGEAAATSEEQRRWRSAHKESKTLLLAKLRERLGERSDRDSG